MRLYILYSTRTYSKLEAPKQIMQLGFLMRPQGWAVVSSRLPYISLLGLSPLKRDTRSNRVFDSGFFFPTTHPWVEGFRVLKKFHLTTKTTKGFSLQQTQAATA